ncbi:MAG TPA: dihydrofolate reductase family protein [Solirubrobacterales bacterium]|nr:dihydrofolate reductase family protein [Solirubrobacterales bacterium]
MRRLLPEPGPTTISEQLETYRPWEEAPEERPLVAMNFVSTLDGRATIEGRSGPIGSETDTAMLAGLRCRFDAVMIGAGTMRVEQYGPLASKQETRERRERSGLPPEPLMVLISGRLDLPWDASLFAEGGNVLIFTSSEAEPPEVGAEVEVVRHEGAVNFTEALRHLREERGVRALLSEGGPHVHEQMQADGLVDDLFLTIAPKLSGGEGPRILEGPLPEVAELELLWLLEEEGELYARYRRT